MNSPEPKFLPVGQGHTHTCHKDIKEEWELVEKEFCEMGTRESDGEKHMINLCYIHV